tara:strand:+ start:1061 stop:1222 length:162 start_codon:yes stop_codon:yes gene_type:complete
MLVGDLVEMVLLTQVVDLAVITEIREDGSYVTDGLKYGIQILPPDTRCLREIA